MNKDRFLMQLFYARARLLNKIVGLFFLFSELCESAVHDFIMSKQVKVQYRTSL